MVIIYAHTNTARLQYTCHLIFKELLGNDFMITNNPELFENSQGVKVSYDNGDHNPQVFSIKNTGLLFQTGISEQSFTCFEVEKYKAFFKTADADFPFDIFSATFYLVSRYEEYLPHVKDDYGRYAHVNSLAYKESFLNLPLINIWVRKFAAVVKIKFPFFSFHLSPFVFTPTYDIDIAYSYKYKGIFRNTGGFLKAPSVDRIKVLLNLEKDPFDTYNWLDAVHEKYDLKAHYFFLVADKNGKYDKNILPHKKAMKRLLERHAEKYPIGIHPSWQSGDVFHLLEQEKSRLEKMTGKVITKSRQHYIRFTLPEGYRKLIAAGITDDYSMGYGSINGFRASIASSFYWYDLEKEEQTLLRIHPFCFMEANAFYEQKYTAEQAYEEMMLCYNICKNTGGEMIAIWHNNAFGTDPTFKGWKEAYVKFIAQALQ